MKILVAVRSLGERLRLLRRSGAHVGMMVWPMPMPSVS